MSLVQSLVVLMLVANPATGSPEEASSVVSTGTRYWDVIETYLDPESRLFRSASSRGNRNRAGNRVFIFDRIRMLDAPFLLLAARSSIHRTRYESRGATEAAISRKFIQNFDLCLQYYPLLADSDEDLEAILNAIRHLRGNKYFRTYLIRRCVPGLASDSLFALYLQENLAPRRRELKTILQKNLMYKDEDPLVAVTSMDALFQLPRNDIARALAADPAVQAYEKEKGRAFSLLLADEKDAPALSHKTRSLCDTALRDISGTARFLASRRSPEKCASPYVRNQIKAYVERACREYPLSDKKDLLALVADGDDGQGA